MKVQRRPALRSSCAYRTVSYAAANIISALPPIDLLVDERTYAYWLRKEGILLPLDADAISHTTSSPAALRQKTLERWVTRLATETKGSWTRSLIKDVLSWCNRKHGQLTFHLMQSLSAHGCFGKNLCISERRTLKSAITVERRWTMLTTHFLCARAGAANERTSSGYWGHWIQAR